MTTSLPRRTSEKKLPKAGEHEFPALFTVEGSSRHESKYLGYPTHKKPNQTKPQIKPPH